MEQHQQTVHTKAEIMVEHFITNVVNPKKLKGKAKAMVVTQNIPSAIRYFQAIRQILADRQSRFKAIIAFSGEKEIDGVTYTEDALNGFSGKDIKDKFDTDEYRLLVVANKFLTGFDQPKLSAMYVDKRLQGVLAVQALSRLNRSANSLGKRTEDLFVLDFFNAADDIKAAFDPYYTSTSLSEATDVNVLHELKDQLDMVGVYEWEEVEEFVENYFKGVDAQLLSPLIDRAASRFTQELDLSEDAKADFKIKAKQFVKIYGQMAAIMPFEKLSWEKLFWFLKFLIPKLTIRNPEEDRLDELLNSVDLSTYGLERTKLGHSIELEAEETALDPQNANPRGANPGDVEVDPLDSIIQSFNERWFQGWDATPEEQKIILVPIISQMKQHPDFVGKYLNNPDTQNRQLAFLKILQDTMNKLRKGNMDLYRKYIQDEGFRQAFTDVVARGVNL